MGYECLFFLTKNEVTAVDIARVFGWDKIIEELVQHTQLPTMSQEQAASQEQSAPHRTRTLSQVHECRIHLYTIG